MSSIPPSEKSASVTIQDVAAYAGVSVSTVSRVLNNKPDVNKRTRERVQDAIEQLGYVPYVQVVGRNTVRRMTLALLFPMDHRSRASFTQTELDFLLGASTACGIENGLLNLFTTPLPDDELETLLTSGHIDGVLLMEPLMEDWRVEMLRQYAIPFVMIGRCADNTGLSFVDLDGEQALIRMFDHLVGLGHRRIGFLYSEAKVYEQPISYVTRLWRGYQAALKKHGLDEIYRHVALDVRSRHNATLDLMSAEPDVTAIVTTYGATASGIFSALQQLEREIPDDVSVIGIGGENVAALTLPALTTIHLEGYDLAFRAMQMLIKKLRGEPLDLEQVLVYPELVVRGSTRPPR